MSYWFCLRWHNTWPILGKQPPCNGINLRVESLYIMCQKQTWTNNHWTKSFTWIHGFWKPPSVFEIHPTAVQYYFIWNIQMFAYSCYCVTQIGLQQHHFTVQQVGKRSKSCYHYQITSPVKDRLSLRALKINTSIQRQLTGWVWANHIISQCSKWGKVANHVTITCQG